MKKLLFVVFMALTGQMLMADVVADARQKVNKLLLADALNNQTLAFTTGGDANWFAAQSEATYGGAQTAQSGAIGDSQSTWLKTTVSGVGVLSFKWKVSSESSYDYVAISIDGTEKSCISGTGGTWTTFSTDVLTAGEHEVIWTYCKDSSVSSGSDCAWVTDVVWQPITGPVTVAFDACGGDVKAAPQRYSFGDTYVKLPVPTREGCMFLGWFTQKDGGERVTEGDVVRFSASTLYAHWITQKFIKIVDPKGIFTSLDFTDVGTWSTDYSYVRWQMGAEDQGSRVDVLTATFSTEREGVLKFSDYGYGIGVEIDGEYAEEVWTGNGYAYAIPEGGEHTLTLYFDYAQSDYYAAIRAITVQEAPDSFAVAFDSCGGSCSETKRIYQRGDTYGMLPTPTLAGCIFEGWSASEWNDEFVSDDDVASFAAPTLYARWQVDSVAKFLGEDSGITFTKLTNENWSVQAYCYGESYLSWRSPSYIKGNVETVVLEATVQGAGTLRIPTTLSGNMNLTLTINGVVQTNYYVGGWSDYGDGRVNEYRVYFGRHSGRDIEQKFLTSGGHRIKLALNATADSYEYGEMSIGQMTWEAAPSRVEVTFNANGGSASTTAKTYSTGSVYGSFPTPKRAGCTFMGWYTSKYGGRQVKTSDLVDWSVCELYAHWSAQIKNTMPSGVSNIRVGRNDIYSDGDGVVFPIPTWDDAGMPVASDNYFEVTCSGEAIISFDWVLDVALNGSENYYGCSASHRFTIDGNEVLTHEKDFGYQSVSMFYRDNPRKTVKAFLTPGTHVLRWEIVSGFAYAYDNDYDMCDINVRCAVENFKIDEKPVANRESLFDWCKLGYEYFVWKPDNLDYLCQKYTARINKNKNDYDAYVWRALTKIVKLGENAKAREIIGRFGYTIADYTFMPSGEFVGLAHAPLSNDAVDEITPEILSTLDSALADIKKIPEDWTGRIEIHPEDFGAKISENSEWADEKIYYGLAEVSIVRAGIEAMRAAVKLARGYDYEADYIAISNAAARARREGCSHIYEFKDVAPRAGSIRNYGEILEAKEDFRAALLSVRRADLSIENRPEYAAGMSDYGDFLVEYDLEGLQEVTEYRKIYNAILASLDATNAVDISWFADKYDTDDVLRTYAPGGLLSRQLFLGALFAGTITRDLIPDVFVKPTAVDMDTVKDFTFGGLLPDVTFSEVLGRLPFSQTWSVENYIGKGSPGVLLGKNETFHLRGTARGDGEIAFTAAASGALTCSIDGKDFSSEDVAAGDNLSFEIQKGQNYELDFTPCGVMPNAVVPIAVTSLPKPEFVSPDWKSVTKGDSMTVYAVVKDVETDEFVEALGSLLAAFDKNGECRGIAEIGKGPFGQLFQLSIGIESAAETGFALKVWDANTGEISDIIQKVDSNAEKLIGAINDPDEFWIGMKSQTLDLYEGWSWISFCIVPEDAAISTMFADCGFVDNDMLKAPDRIVTYYGGKWYPADYELKPGVAYMVRKSGEGVDQVKIAGLPMEDGLAVSAGWNWFGSTLQSECELSSVMHTGGFANQDLVKSSSNSATWYAGQWYPEDFVLVPGVGYQAKFAHAGALYFKETSNRTAQSGKPLFATLAAPSDKPGWKGVTKGDTMAVYAVVSNLMSQTMFDEAGTLLAAFDKTGECRGVAEIEDGPFGRLFQLSVGIESSEESGLVLKLWDSESRTALDVLEGIDANALWQIGAFDAPALFTVFADAEEGHQLEVIVGAKSEIDVGFVGYAAKNLPKGLTYNAKTGKVTGTVKAEGEFEVMFTKKGEADETMKFVVRKENEPMVECEALDVGDFTVGVAGIVGGIPLTISAESGVKSVTAKNLPTGMKIVQDKMTKAWYVQGGATKAGSYTVRITVTTAAGSKIDKDFNVTVAALSETAVGTFNGFVRDCSGLTFGAVQVTTTDAGKITAKITAASKTYSFSAACWDSVVEGCYHVEMPLKTGETLSLALDSSAGWDGHQLAGGLHFLNPDRDYEVSAQRNAFGKTWYFNAEGNESEGWTFSYAENPKTAALTLTLNADGKTSIAGKLGTLKVSASGYADVSGMSDGAIIADFAPVVTLNKAKKILSISANLWFDRSNGHEFVGGASIVE